jgi:hypothetical protein
MITAKQAAEKAAAYLRALVPIQQPPVLEEVERDGANWTITLSFVPPNTTPYGLAMLGGKEYKIFKVRGADGEIISMKIRSVK